MEKILYRMISDAVENVDTYVNNGSTWLIFTEEKRWVIELTKDGTLWYNYGFFRNIFSYLSTDVIENQQYITKWVEDNIINKKKPVKNGVKSTSFVNPYFNQNVEDTIQNGVKETKKNWSESKYQVEDTIQNGVKETISTKHPFGGRVEDTIQNGIKQTCRFGFGNEKEIEDAIQNGVKHTEYGDWEDCDVRLEDIIKDGIKKTKTEKHHRLREVVQTVNNGIKETNWRVVENYPEFEERVIKNGIKEVQPLPAQDGNRDWGLYYKNREDRTKPHTKYVEEVISEGNKIHDI